MFGPKYVTKLAETRPDIRPVYLGVIITGIISSLFGLASIGTATIIECIAKHVVEKG